MHRQRVIERVTPADLPHLHQRPTAVSVPIVKPDSSWTKPMIVDWLEQHGVNASEDELKANLLAKVEVA